MLLPSVVINLTLAATGKKVYKWSWAQPTIRVPKHGIT